jgi:predicted enzyme related to lactoylglutathione lyase
MDTTEFTAPVVNTVAFDCHDPDRLAAFWTALLGVEIRHRAHEFIWLTSQRKGGVTLAFQKVPDPTPGKNKLHLDGHHEDLEALTARVEQLGGSFVQQHVVPTFTWNIYADPEGNQFCCGHALESPQD